MSKQLSLWGVDDHLSTISAKGDPLEKLAPTVGFDRFRPFLEKAAGCPRGAKGGRTAPDVVLKFKTLVLPSCHGLSLDAKGQRRCRACRRKPHAQIRRQGRKRPPRRGQTEIPLRVAPIRKCAKLPRKGAACAAFLGDRLPKPNPDAGTEPPLQPFHDKPTVKNHRRKTGGRGRQS